MIPKPIFCGMALSLLTLTSGAAQAQTLFLNPPRFHLNNRPFNGTETHTISLIVDFGMERAVSWGTDISLGSTSLLEFVPDFGGAGKPFKSTQSFFGADYSDYSDAGIADGDAILHLNFLNLPPNGEFGQTGRVTLGQFQVRVKAEQNYPENANFGGYVNLSPLGSPPFGSAVEDIDGNNLLVAANGAVITSRPPSPEPSTWITMVCGVGMGWAMIRRRSQKGIRD